MYLLYIPALLAIVGAASVQNSTYSNPILPGFHPDPSCTFVPEWNNTFFCASSSFNAFPGIPIHASRDLQTFKLVSNALNRPEQLPALATTNRSTGGIWAPTLRYHEGTFYITTTLVFDDRLKNDTSRWDNLILTSTNPYSSSSWSDPVHFNFTGYDTSPYWDEDGQVYINGAHAWEVWPGILQTTIDLKTGVTGAVTNPWNGTGGQAPEGPHIYKKDEYYYLQLAEGGTGLNHMVTYARSQSIHGPWIPNPLNPVLTNANTSAYFQAVGHADVFKDVDGNWWAVALSVRSGPKYLSYPMGRETVLTPVSWAEGDFPTFTNVSGCESGWRKPPQQIVEEGEGQLVGAPDALMFPSGSTIPPHLIHWRLPVSENYVVSPAGHENTLQLTSSPLNLTAYDGYYTGGAGQTFIGRRQTDTLFTYSVDLDFSDLKMQEDEAGISIFLVQRYHFDLGVVMLPSNDTTSTSLLSPHLRFRGISGFDANNTSLKPIPASWGSTGGNSSEKITLQIQAVNETHYALSAGPYMGIGANPESARANMLTLGYCMGSQLSWGFTGSLVGVYATTNGRNDTSSQFNAWVENWRYVGQGQVID